LPCRASVNVERRMSISSYLVLQRRAARRLERAASKERLWSRWYVPLLAAALVLVVVIAAAIAALEIVTATHEPRPAPVTRPARVQPGSRAEPAAHVEHGSHLEPEPDVELISAER
jgi:cytochrome c-type biogenesis protein CcmH/NrfG